MKNFLDDNFLLENGVAEVLYFDFARQLPIFDFHCHLPPGDIYENRTFANLTEAWLEGDHYKWRAMRAVGVPEKFITGDASPREKFRQWATTVPQAARNPLYHWTHLELQRYFGIDKLLDERSADDIYDRAGEMLTSMPVRAMQQKMNVALVCTVEDPLDDLGYHRKLGEENYEVKTLTTFRPDALLNLNEPGKFMDYLAKMAVKTGKAIDSFDRLLEALQQRIDYFHALGCRLSDHGLETLFYEDYSKPALEGTLKALRNGESVEETAARVFKSALLTELSKMYHAKGWAQMFHLGALRNTNTRLRQAAGADCGADSIGDFPQAVNMARFFNRLDRDNALAKTIVFNLNPADNEVFASMMGNFNDGSMRGKMQYGSGWWFLDQKDGIERQINALSNLGMLSTFVGMVTDSRSFLSYPRHEYFRRILCNLIGRDVVKGELPYDVPWLGSMIERICFHNAKNYFNFV